MTTSLLIAIINSYQNYSNFKRIFNFYVSCELNAVRSFEVNCLDKSSGDNINLAKDSRFVVPGDIIQIVAGSKFMCDVIILRGYCAVSEGDITGESRIEMKSQLPNNSVKFDYTNNYNSLIFAGSSIEQCNSTNESEKVYALVINTGINTLRGNSIQNTLFPKKSNFTTLRQRIIYFIIIALLWVVYFLLVTYIYYYIHLKEALSVEEKNTHFTQYIKVCIEIVVVLFPPTLPICFIFICFYFQYKLGNKNIKCLSDTRLYAAGRVNILILDKTGTLTEDEVEFYGFQTTLVSQLESNPRRVTEFDRVETDAKLYNKIYLDFWKMFSNDPDNPVFDNYEENYQFNMIYFLECLATCHGVDRMNNESLGNSVDIKILNKVQWLQDKSQFVKNDNDALKYDIYPKNSFKITEDTIFRNLKEEGSVKSNPFRHTILKRFPFDSKYQSMSVIVKNNFDNSFRYFIKGAPEKIFHICDTSSIPLEFHEVLEDHTKQGFRVLACATKTLPEKKDYDIGFDRRIYETKLRFLGFILFKNKLKSDSKILIDKLKQTDIKLVMSTGDNPFTSISVARECNLISNNIDNIYLCELEKTITDDNEKLRCYAVHNEKKVNEIGDSRDVNFITGGIDDRNYKSEMTGQHKRISKLKTQRKTKALSISSNEIKNSIKHDKSSKIILMQRKTITQDICLEDPFKNVQDVLTKLRKFVDKAKNNIVAISGKAFNYIMEKYDQEKELNKDLESKFISNSKLNENTYEELLHIIEHNCKVFYRMQPNDKVSLVNFYKSNPQNLIAMCGDGSNDCGALFCADVGIAIRKKSGANISSHFFYDENSIGCIDVILKNGRSCIENSILVLKFTFSYSVLQMTYILFLYSHNSDMSPSQYLYLDIFTLLILCLIGAKLSANYSFEKDGEEDALFSVEWFISLIAQIILAIITAVSIIFQQINIKVLHIKTIKSYINDKHQTDVLDRKINIINSHCFLLNAFQNITLMFVFNSKSRHRKVYYLNKVYIAYMGLLLFYLVAVVTLPDIFKGNSLMFGFRIVEIEYLQFKQQYEENDKMRILLAMTYFLYFFSALILDFLVNKIFRFKINFDKLDNDNKFENLRK